MEWRRTVLVVRYSFIPMPVLTEVLQGNACVREATKVPWKHVELSDLVLGLFQSFVDYILEFASLFII